MVMTAQYGAHEVMEIHEVLTDTINGINQFQLYSPYVKDQQLNQILDRQVQFMVQEYNNLLQVVNQRGMSQATPYRTPMTNAPVYGLNNPTPEAPNSSMNQMNDRDVASGMLGCHKSSAIMRMMASLECADTELRHMIQQGANNCAEEAYEVWQFMNQQGYYQVPTMKESTTNTMLNAYTAASTNAGQTTHTTQYQQ
jgi:spore coat protein CotF